MLLSPLGPGGKLRPEWEFGIKLGEHSSAAGPGPIYGSSPIRQPSVLSSFVTPVCSQLWWPSTKKDTWPDSVRTGADGFHRKGRRDDGVVREQPGGWTR